MSTTKFGRTYTMSVQGQKNTWTPAFPTTLELDVQRNTFASANKATFTLYNLAQDARRDIYFDRFVNNQQLRVTLNAGYESAPAPTLIFQGDIRVAWTERRGIDWVTQVECFDGGFAIYNAFVSASLPVGYTMQSAAKTLVETMKPYGVTLGQVSNIYTPSYNETPLLGNTWQQLQSITPGDGQLFIDGGVCHILNADDYIMTPTIPVIAPETGLLGTPRRQGSTYKVRTIFDPQFVVGQLVELRSLEDWLNNPRLKVVGIHHYGKISAAQSGDLITELDLFAGYDKKALTAAGAGGREEAIQ